MTIEGRAKGGSNRNLGELEAKTRPIRSPTGRMDKK